MEEHVGRWDEDVGTAQENNVEQKYTNLPTASERRPLVAYKGPHTNHSSRVQDVWSNGAMPFSAW